MQRYESYLTRRVAFDTTGMTAAQIQAADAAFRANPKTAALNRLYAIRDLIRMEMPDRLGGCNVDVPLTLPGWAQYPTLPDLPYLYLYYNRLSESASRDGGCDRRTAKRSGRMAISWS